MTEQECESPSVGFGRVSKLPRSPRTFLPPFLPPAAVKVFAKCSFLHAAPQCLPLLDGENDREGEGERESKGAWEPIQPCEKASLSIGARERGRTTDDGTSEAARMMKADAATSPPSVVPWNRQNARRRNRKRPDRDSAGRLGDRQCGSTWREKCARTFDGRYAQAGIKGGERTLGLTREGDKEKNDAVQRVLLLLLPSSSSSSFSSFPFPKVLSGASGGGREGGRGGLEGGKERDRESFDGCILEAVGELDHGNVERASRGATGG